MREQDAFETQKQDVTSDTSSETPGHIDCQTVCANEKFENVIQTE